MYAGDAHEKDIGQANVMLRQESDPTRLHLQDKLNTKSTPLNSHIKEKDEDTRTIKGKERRNGSEVLT